MHMPIEVSLELLEQLIGDHEGVADINRDGTFLGEVADRVSP